MKGARVRTSMEPGLWIMEKKSTQTGRRGKKDDY